MRSRLARRFQIKLAKRAVGHKSLQSGGHQRRNGDHSQLSGRHPRERAVRSGDRWSVARSAASGRPLCAAQTPVSLQYLHGDFSIRIPFQDSVPTRVPSSCAINRANAGWAVLLNIVNSLFSAWVESRASGIRKWVSRIDPGRLDGRQHPRN
jgi:hypothetical protein